jgi:hypothetical protein
MRAGPPLPNATASGDGFRKGGIPELPLPQESVRQARVKIRVVRIELDGAG